MNDYKSFGAEWEIEMLKFKKQDLVEMLRASLKKNQKYESIPMDTEVGMPSETLSCELEARLDENQFWYDTLTEVFYTEGVNELSQQYLLKIRNAIEQRIEELKASKP